MSIYESIRSWAAGIVIISILANCMAGIILLVLDMFQVKHHINVCWLAAACGILLISIDHYMLQGNKMDNKGFSYPAQRGDFMYGEGGYNPDE